MVAVGVPAALVVLVALVVRRLPSLFESRSKGR
jgi:hypothetical protein